MKDVIDTAEDAYEQALLQGDPLPGEEDEEDGEEVKVKMEKEDEEKEEEEDGKNEEEKEEDEEEKEKEGKKTSEFGYSESGSEIGSEEEEEDEIDWDEDNPAMRFKAYEELEDLFEVRAPVTPYQRRNGGYVRLDWEKAELEKKKAQEEEAAKAAGLRAEESSKNEAFPSKERYPNAIHRLLAILFNPKFYDHLTRTMEYDMTRIQDITTERWQTAHVALKFCEDTAAPENEQLFATEQEWMSYMSVATAAFHRLIPRNVRDPPRLRVGLGDVDIIASEADLVDQLSALDEIPLLQNLDKIMKAAARYEDMTMRDDGNTIDIVMEDVGETEAEAAMFERQLAALGMADVTHCEYCTWFGCCFPSS